MLGGKPFIGFYLLRRSFLYFGEMSFSYSFELSWILNDCRQSSSRAARSLRIFSLLLFYIYVRKHKLTFVRMYSHGLCEHIEKEPPWSLGLRTGSTGPRRPRFVVPKTNLEYRGFTFRDSFVKHSWWCVSWCSIGL